MDCRRAQAEEATVVTAAVAERLAGLAVMEEAGVTVAEAAMAVAAGTW